MKGDIHVAERSCYQRTGRRAGRQTSAGRVSSGPTPPQTWSACAVRSTSSTRWPALAPRRLWELLHTEDYVPALGASTGNQAMQSQGRSEGHLHERLAGGGRQQPGRSRCILTRASIRPTACPSWCAPSTMPCMRADQIYLPEGKEGPYWFAPIVADAESGFGGSAERLRTHEGHDRGRRGRRAFRRPAFLGQEVRPHGRQGAGPAAGVHPEADRRPPGRRYHGCAHDHRGPHGCAQRDPDHQRRGPARRTVADRSALGQKATTTCASGVQAAIATRPGLCTVCRPVLVGDLRSEPGRSAEFAEAIHKQYPGKLLAYNCSPSFNWKKKLDDATIAKFQRELGGDGLQVPVRHPGRFPCPEPQHVSTWPWTMHSAAWPPMLICSRRSLPARATATRPPSTSVRLARATSTRSPRSISGGTASTLALLGSTEEAQFA